MPPTPSPFRVPPRPNALRPNPSPQFASTPRFLLQQDTPRLARDKEDIDADESPYSTPIPPRWTGRKPRPRRHEVIDDSEDNLSQDIESSRHRDDIIDRDISGSPPGPVGTIDAEFELLFGSAKDRSKRRRISVDADTPATQRERTRPEPIFSSSPSEAPAPTLNTSPVPGSGFLPPTQEPTPSKPGPTPSTPGATKTPFRNYPRFKLSSTQQQPPSSQPQFFTTTPFPARDSSPHRRKPTFILPRSPSPSGAAEEDPSIRTPFSPSSHTLHRRGRARGGPPGYLPGGMAAEVRSWILETGAKREQPAATPDPSYLFTARVETVWQSRLGSAGPVAFVAARCVSLSGEEAAVAESRNILLFGAPRAKAELSTEGVQELRTGSLVGVHRGLVWEIELDSPDDENNGGSGSRASREGGSAEMERWTVCMEWDLIE